MTDKTKEFIDKALLVHGNKYDYSKVEYKKTIEKVIIICNEHGEFEQKPYKHLSKQGCAKCIGRNFTKKEFVNQANIKHNNKFNYLMDVNDNFIIKKNDKINIICPIHNIFKQSIAKHLQGNGCPKCNPSYKDDKDRFIQKFTKTYPEKKYNFEQTNYINSSTKFDVICENNHLFQIRPNDLLNGHGCNLCANLNSSLRNTISLNDIIEKINLLHGGNIDTSKVTYYGTDEKCIFICNIHNVEYNQRPHNLFQGKNGCYKCSKSKQYSNVQIQWLNFIEAKDNICIQHAENIGEYQIPNTKFKADGYCKETNTIYEYHGDYWHGNPFRFNSNEINKTTKCTFGELYQNTLNKEQQIRDLGFNLITIWESDWIKLNKCVKLLQRKFRISKLH